MRHLVAYWGVEIALWPTFKRSSLTVVVGDLVYHTSRAHYASLNILSWKTFLSSLWSQSQICGLTLQLFKSAYWSRCPASSWYPSSFSYLSSGFSLDILSFPPSIFAHPKTFFNLISLFVCAGISILVHCFELRGFRIII